MGLYEPHFYFMSISAKDNEFINYTELGMEFLF